MTSIPSALNSNTSKPGVELYAEARVPLAAGTFKIQVYRTLDQQIEHLVISQGDLTEKAPFLRMHSECLTGEVLGSLRCDCKAQLDAALAKIAQDEHGMIIYLRNHEGRGIGLGNKIRAYQLQDEGLDTIEANHALGFPDDLRDFSAAVAILKSLQIDSVRLNTNNPAKVAALTSQGVVVDEIVPSLSPTNPHNEKYLHTKFSQLGHFLDKLFK